MMITLMNVLLMKLLLQTGDGGTTGLEVATAILLWLYNNSWKTLLIILGYFVLRWAYSSAKRLVEGTGPALAFLILGVTVVMTLLLIGGIFVAIWGVPKLGAGLYGHSVKQLNSMESEYPLPGTPMPDATQPPNTNQPPTGFQPGKYTIKMAAGQGTTCTLKETSDRFSNELGVIPNGTEVQVTSWVPSNPVAGCAFRGNINPVGAFPTGWIHCACVVGP